LTTKPPDRPSTPARRPGRGSSRKLGAVRTDPESTAAGIYGIIVSSAVMASSSAATTVRLVANILTTLIVYWAAERYARLVAERLHEGSPPSLDVVREQLTYGWELVTATALPLLTLVVLRLTGLAQSTAVFGALICATVLLGLAGWELGTGGRLTVRERVVSATVAAAFGVLMIGLKTLPHH
jgi:hypothetical protein